MKELIVTTLHIVYPTLTEHEKGWLRHAGIYYLIGNRVTTIINDYLLSFFNMTLKGETTGLFEDQSEKYIEVKIIQ